jgi:hypothetical protein
VTAIRPEGVIMWGVRPSVDSDSPNTFINKLLIPLHTLTAIRSIDGDSILSCDRPLTAPSAPGDGRNFPVNVPDLTQPFEKRNLGLSAARPMRKLRAGVGHLMDRPATSARSIRGAQWEKVKVKP